MSKQSDGPLHKVANFFATAFRDVAFIDPRSLSLFRIGLGLCLFFDFTRKWVDLTPFYTDAGLLPRELAIKNLGWWSFSFHLASGAYWFQSLLVVVGLLLATALTLGYRTRWVTFLLWIFIVSLHGRNSIILHSGDVLFRVMTFWAMFLPLEARWSLDNLNRPKAQRKFQGGVANIASLAILLQLLYMYFFTGVLKSDPEWRESFVALYYAMNLDQFTTTLGVWLSQYLGVMKFLTFVTIYLEIWGPILLIVPFIQQRLARWILPWLFIGLHISLILTMYLGLFPWICLVSWFLFFPTGLWEFLDRTKIRVPDMKPAGRWILAHLPSVPDVQYPNWLLRIRTVFIAIALVGVTVWNIKTLPEYSKGGVPNFIRTWALPLRLDQYWSMFAPKPMRADGWFVVEGELMDGTSFDTWNGISPVSFDRPDNFFKLYRSTMWRKYLTNVWVEEESHEIRLAFGRYVCREWNDFKNHKKTPGRQLARYELFYMREFTRPHGERPVIERQSLWQHDCFARPDVPFNDSPPVVRDR